jgi:ketopantoate reductase
MQVEQAETYCNAMESLVAEEFDKQLRQMPSRLQEYIRKPEVIAFALNRLPALYATSEKGWRQQRMRGKQEWAAQITLAVRQAIAAIQRDPLRVSVPLRLKTANTPDYALQELRTILQQDDLTWEDMADAVEQALCSTARGDITWHRRVREDELSTNWSHENDRYYR